jgi:hypothetical protein
MRGTTVLRRYLLMSCLIFVAIVTLGQSDDSTVRKEIDQAYERLNLANQQGDLDAVLAMKTSDFHSIFPGGTIVDYETMKQYSERFMKNNSKGLQIKITIQKLTVSEHRLIAIAEVLQEAVRPRELSGKTRELRTSVVQRETWSRTKEGWKLKSVDDVHDAKTFVDGKRMDPTKPYDPDAPPFVPPN